MRNYLNVFIIAPCILFCFPILYSGVYYRDDYWRVVTGENFWGWAGRQGADQLAHLLSLSRHHVDSYPLGFILSVFFLCATFVYIAKFLSSDKNYAKITLPLLFISPFFIQNLAYRFDAPQMIIALSLSVLAFYRSDAKLINMLLSAMLIFFSLTLYQPCVNIFLGLVAVNYCFNVKKSRLSNLKASMLDLLIFFASYVLYYFVQKVIVGSIPRSSMVSLFEIPESMFYSLKYIYELLNDLLAGYSLVFIAIFICFSIISLFLIYVDFLRRSNRRDGLLGTITFLVIPFLLYLSAVGPSFLLEEGVTDIRVLVGFSAITFFFGVAIYKKIPEKIAFCLMLIPIYIACVTCFQFSNAAKAQRFFEENILSQVTSDLSAINNINLKVYVSGHMPIAPIADVIAARQPFVMRLLSPMESWISGPALMAHGNENVIISWSDNTSNKVGHICNDDTSPIVNNKFYEIYTQHDYAVVYFKGKGSICK